jgi:hypothetical protein
MGIAYKKFLSEILKRRGELGSLDIISRVILKWILEK